MSKNPYANADGSPKEGQEFDFWNWSVDEDKKRIDKLPEPQKEAELKAAKHLRDKMES